MLKGDELGVLLADHVLSTTSGDDRLVATTIVSSTMLSAMAKRPASPVSRLSPASSGSREQHFGVRGSVRLGYEEALGYQVATPSPTRTGCRQHWSSPR